LPCVQSQHCARACCAADCNSLRATDTLWRVFLPRLASAAGSLSRRPSICLGAQVDAVSKKGGPKAAFLSFRYACVFGMIPKVEAGFRNRSCLNQMSIISRRTPSRSHIGQARCDCPLRSRVRARWRRGRAACSGYRTSSPGRGRPRAGAGRFRRTACRT